MPLPWKKAKVTRISRLVADLHQPPKRGGSLVVETGFPTSLIDLFVKNRDRLRKPSKRKAYCSSSPQIQVPPAVNPPKPPPSPPCKDEPQSPPQIDAEELVFDVRRECDDGRIAFRAAAFKIFVVVALAVSTKSLAVWVMFAAFLLVLIEFVGMQIFGFSEALIPNSLKRWEQGSAQELAEKQTIELEDDNSVGEIQQIAEPESDSVDKRPESETLATLMKAEETETEPETETEKRREVLICKSERGRRAKIKANLKKFVPKKLRHGKKQEKSSINKLEEIEEEEEEEDDDVAEDEPKSEEEVEPLRVEMAEEKAEREAKGKSGYLILFVIIALAGLIGGRGLALSLMLLCCLAVTYFETLRTEELIAEEKKKAKAKAKAKQSIFFVDFGLFRPTFSLAGEGKVG